MRGSVEEVDCVFLAAASCYNSHESGCHDSTFASRATNASSCFGSDTRPDAYMPAKAISSTTHLYQRLVPADSWSQGAHGDYARGVIRVLLGDYACERTKDEIKCPTTRHIGPLMVSIHFVEKTPPKKLIKHDISPRDLAHLAIETPLIVDMPELCLTQHDLFYNSMERLGWQTIHLACKQCLIHS